ncbi:MAG: glycosyltransferase family 4 protein [Desulfovibrionaceae bacterium]|nr:glycosyltransferase family 4 protein [Desulfovibrionaceae bacterium]
MWSPQDGPRAAALRESGVTLFLGGDATTALRRFAPQIAHLHRPGWPQPEFMRAVRAGLRFLPDGTHLPRLVETNVFGRHDPSPGGKLIDCTLFVSHFCARRFASVENRRAAAPRYGVLYNPVDTDFLGEHCLAPERRDYGRPVLGRISRPDKGKWSRLALDMLQHLARLRPDFCFHVVGGIPEAEDFARERGLASQVRFLAPVQSEGELAAFLDGLSVLAHANDTGESFGLAIAEAMAAGLPVVTHPCEGLKDNAQLELVEHGLTGLVAENAEEYASAVAWLFAHPEEARRMGRAGRSKAGRLYAVDVVVRQLEAVYDALLSGERI